MYLRLEMRLHLEPLSSCGRHTLEWARVRCLGPELVACSDDAGNACNEMIIGNVYELIYIRWSHVLGHLVGHVMGWSSHYSTAFHGFTRRILRRESLRFDPRSICRL